MAAQTFHTDTNTLYFRLLKWILIAAGAFVVIGNGYKFINGLDVNYLNLLTGACFFIVGLFFNNYFKNITITIGDSAIRYHRSKTGICPEKEQRYSWDTIKKVSLYNRHIRIVANDTTNNKIRLPYYTNHQFQEIKQQLRSMAEEHNASFKVQSWW